MKHEHRGGLIIFSSLVTIRAMWCTSAPSVTLTQASYKLKMPEAVCFCLQTCKCGFDIRVVLCTSVPSGTLTQHKFYCLRLFVVVYKLVIHVC